MNLVEENMKKWVEANRPKFERQLALATELKTEFRKGVKVDKEDLLNPNHFKLREYVRIVNAIARYEAVLRYLRN